jgi:PAS domain S-box-containing protein
MLQRIIAYCQGRLAHPHVASLHSASLALEFRGHFVSPLRRSLHNILAYWRALQPAAPPHENFYRALVRHAPDGMFVVNRAQQFVEVNDSLCRMWGLSRREILAQTLPEFLAEADCEPEFFSDLLACRPGRGELRITPATGAARILELETTPMPHALFFGTARDMTESRQREEELRRAAEWRALLLRSLNEGLGIIDCEGRTLLCNRAFEAGLGLSAQQLQEVSLLKPYWQTAERQCLWSLCNGRGTPVFGPENPFYRAVYLQQRVRDCRLHVQPRGKTLAVDAAPLQDERNNLLAAVVTLRDISPQYRQEQERERSGLQRQQASCFAAQRALAGEVALALEEPSTGIALYAQMLLNQLSAGSEEAVLAHGIAQETRGLLEVIRELRAMSKSGGRNGASAKSENRRRAPKPVLDLCESAAWPLAGD